MIVIFGWVYANLRSIKRVMTWHGSNPVIIVAFLHWWLQKQSLKQIQ